MFSIGKRRVRSKMTGFVEVSQNEMMVVDGGGISGAVVGIVLGATSSGFWAACQYVYAVATGNNSTSYSDMGKGILTSMRDGAITGGLIGLITPNP